MDLLKTKHTCTVYYILGCDTIRSDRNLTYFEGVYNFRVENNIHFVHFATQAPSLYIQDGQEVTVHPDNMQLRLNLSLHSTACSTM